MPTLGLELPNFQLRALSTNHSAASAPPTNTHTHTQQQQQQHRPSSQTWKSQQYSRQNSGEAGPPVQRKPHEEIQVGPLNRT